MTLLTDTVLDLTDTETPIAGEFNHVAGQATFQELVYFGAAWIGLDTYGYSMTPRAGWTNATIYRTETAFLDPGEPGGTSSGFYAGQVERIDPLTGKVTDVILCFQGMQVDPTVAAAVPFVILGAPSDHIQRGIDLYDAILHDPRYADAKIHVTGYSMGTVNASWILAYSLKTYGEAITDQRVDFTSFAPARFHDEAFKWYGIDTGEMDGRWINYQAANDENRAPFAGVDGAGDRDFFGTEVILPTLDTPTGPTDVHIYNHLAIALGLPDWVPAEEQQLIFERTGPVSAIGYTEIGMAQLRIEGDDAGTTLTGLGNDDMIIGGLGRDSLVGNGGDDIFAYLSISDTGQTRETADIIKDFNEGDRIDLSAIDAVQSGLNWGGTNEAFKLVSGTSFTGAGQIVVNATKDATFVMVNTDSDSLVEMVIELTGRHALGAEDFIF